MVAAAFPIASRAPVWPVIIAPVIAGLYYLSIRGAFSKSIVAVLGASAANDIDLSDLAAPQWGAHPFYRLVAEAISAAIAIGIAAGLAPGRARAAAFAGSVAISLGYLVRTGLLILLWTRDELDTLELPEPLYQYAIDAIMIVATPLLARSIAEMVAAIHRQEPSGFGGIHRLHFFWIWPLAYWYALALITPASWIITRDSGIFASVLVMLIHLVPAVAVGIPGYFGLSLLAGRSGTSLPAVLRNFAGSVVLIGGLAIGVGVEVGWYWLVQQVHQALVG